MNWQDFIDAKVGRKRTFSADEVRLLLLDALKFECDNFIKSSNDRNS